jgi:hypothetical protein
MSQREYCTEGWRLYLKYNGICVDKNGDCTSLYYHIQDCDECETRRHAYQREFDKMN